MSNLHRMVSTKTLFQTHGDYDNMNEEERDNYIDQLSEEFIENARDLLEALAGE